MAEGSVVGTVILDVTHSSCEMRWAELRFDRGLTVEELKDKLYHHVGTLPSHMRVFLVCGQDRRQLSPDDASRRFGEFLPPDASAPLWHLHVEDDDPLSSVKSLHAAAAASDPSKRYQMSDEQYGQRHDSARNFLRSLHVKQPELFSTSAEGTAQENICPVDEAKQKYPVAARCRVMPGCRLGEIAFVGELPDAVVYDVVLRVAEAAVERRKSVRVGVRLDEPQGDSDGRHPTNPKRRLVECSGEGYCTFVSPANVEVGDFPPVDPFDLDEI